MGFQIIDDVLDFQGKQQVLGKPVGSDLREGIVTLPVLYYLRAHPDDGRLAAVVHQNGSEDLVGSVVADIRASGAVDRAMDRARAFITESKTSLTVLPEAEPREIMAALADYTISRQK
jgi:geranylgeranyl pyrophosphate synthase